MTDDSESRDEQEADSTGEDVRNGVEAGAAVAGGVAGAVQNGEAGNVAGTAAAVAGAAGAVGGAVGGEAGEAVGTAAAAVQAGGQVAGAVQNAVAGDAAGAVGNVAGAAGTVGGALGGEAGEAVGAAASVVQAGTRVAGAVQNPTSGNITSAASQAADAARYIVPDNEVREALGGAGQAIQSAGQALGGLGGMMGGGGRRINVGYHLTLDDFDAQWGVQRVRLYEQLGGLYECTVQATVTGAAPEVAGLLGLDAHLQFERGEQMRTVHGLVKHAVVDEVHDGHVVRLNIVPAMWLLGQNLRSRVWTNKTVPEVVEAIYAERCGSRRRQIRNELTRTYPTHELLVQFQESDLAFVQRRLEQEGIFTYFVHEGDTEELVLADVNTNLPNMRASDDDQIHWCSLQSPAPDGEGVFEAHHFEEVGAQDVVVSEYNWTAPATPVRGEETGHSELDPPLEVYDHTDSVLFHGYDGSRWPESDASDQARIRKEVLDLTRHRWEMSTLLVTARPGHVFELVGCPDGALDGRYVIVSVDGDGSATESSSGEYICRITAVPHDMPFRPARRAHVPAVPGFQSATVVGPSDQEIHTDEHGRVQVRFPWDREHEPSEHNLCSCWIRVMHSWAGPGFGTTFVPRIGMEVVVSFLNGNPDRPLVIGCLYHGTNTSPVHTPDDKTQSAIRTKSSPNSDGFNELRFEDKAGGEFIYTHAQKDYNEVVENDHSTTVHNNQSNTVDVDQTETVGGDQSMTVHGERTKTVDKDETNTVHQNRTTTVDQDDTEEVGGDRILTVSGHETVTIHKNRSLRVVKKTLQGHDDGREITVKSYDQLKVDGGANRNVHVTGQYNNKVDGSYTLKQADTETLYLNGHIYISSDAKIELVAPDCSIKMEDGKVAIVASNEITLQSGQGTISVKSDGTIEAVGATKVAVDGGGAMGEWSASGVKATGNMVEIGADAVAKLTGTLVKIN